MKKIIFTAIACTIIFILLLTASCNNDVPAPQTKVVAAELAPDEMLTRGKYLVTTIGCNHCHTPKKMTPQGPVLDSSKLLSGHQANSPLPAIDKKALAPGNWVLFAGDLTAAVGPWGISYGANLTPDSVTGIGMWTEEAFIKTLRTGKHLGQDGGRPIMPPMPWESLAALSDQDLKSLYTYLHSLPPVSNKVPAYASPDEVSKMK
jgi:hypothetical protein